MHLLRLFSSLLIVSLSLLPSGAFAAPAGSVSIQLLAFNDFHGNLQPPSGSSGRVVTPNGTVDAGGVEYLATHIKQLEATNPNTLVVVAGDLIGASPLISGLFHDEPTIEAMNALGLDLSSVGNHEFDEGSAELLRMQNGGCHPTDGCQDSDLRDERRMLMNQETFHFKVGQFDCFAVNDGFGTYPNPARILFTGAAEDLLTQVLNEHNIQLEEWSEWVSPFICLLVRTDKNLVLVDTGYGMVDFMPEAGKLVQNLQTLAITPQDIDTVILTHGHRDHLYGVADDATNQVVFSKARHVIWRDEWEFRNSKEGVDFDDGDASRKLSAIAGQLDLIDSEMEIVPGIHAICAPGHTPGHMALAIVSEGEQLLDLVDVVGHPIHLEQPQWNMRTDYQPEVAERTRRMLLDRVAREQSRILAYHFDFPGLGYVQQQQNAWKWRPIVATT